MTPGPARVPVPAGGFAHIAVIRLSSLGDVVLATAAAHALHAAFPEARLSFWTREEYRDLLRFDPAIAHVRALERDARRIEDLVSMSAELEECDLIVDLHGNAAARVLTLRQKARLLRVASWRLRRERWVHARWSRPEPPPPVVERYAAALAPIGVQVAEPPRIVAGADAETSAAAEWESWKPGRTIALCPGALHFTKRWPETHWVDLAERLRARGDALLCFGLQAERRALPELERRLAGDSRARWCTGPLPQIAALMSLCAAAVSGDSGLMHLAAARGTRVVALFGSTAPELGFAPAGAGHVVLCRHEPCQPCTLHGRPSGPKGHFRCMVELSPALVLESVDRILAG